MDLLPYLTTMNRDIGHQQKKYIDEWWLSDAIKEYHYPELISTNAILLHDIIVHCLCWRMFGFFYAKNDDDYDGDDGDDGDDNDDGDDSDYDDDYYFDDDDDGDDDDDEEEDEDDDDDGDYYYYDDGDDDDDDDYRLCLLVHPCFSSKKVLI